MATGSKKARTTYSDARISSNQLSGIANKWITSDGGKFWPDDLTGERMTKDLQLKYAPHWVVSGEATAIWDASVGDNYTVRETCSSCNGRGRTRIGNSTSTCTYCNGTGRKDKTKTRWRREQGTVTAQINGRVIENFVGTSIQCGKRNMQASEYELGSKTLQTFSTRSSSHDAGINEAKQALLKELQSNARSIAWGMGDQAKDVNVLNATLANMKARVWLYPIYVGRAKHDSESLQIQIDGITGKMWARLPTSVKQARLAEARRNWLIASFAVCIIIAGFFLYNEPTIETSELAWAAAGALGFPLFLTFAIVVPIIKAAQKNK